MNETDIESKLLEMSTLFRTKKYDEAETLLQECIDTSRVFTKHFIMELIDSTDDPEVKERVTKLYFLNYL